MAEATLVAGFGKDGERQDGADAGLLLEALEVGVVLEVKRSSLFQLIAQLAEADHLAEYDAKHGNCFRIVDYRDADR